MEMHILSNVNPVYGDIYRKAFADNKLNVYTKELNLDGWIRSLDFYLIYEREAERELAERVIEDLKLESEDEVGMESENDEPTEPDC